MQQGSREMQGLNSLPNNSQISSLNDHQNGFDQSSSHDEYLEQFLLSSCSWPPPDLTIHSPTINGRDSPPPESHEEVPSFHNFDESSFLAAKFRQHQISGVPAMAMMIQQQMMMTSPASVGSGDSELVPLPLSLSDGDLVNRSRNDVIDSSVRGLVNGFTGSLNSSSQLLNQNHQFHVPQGGTMQAQNFGAPAASINGAPPNGSNGGGAPTQPRQRIRARRGQATDPHSIAERLRRERIAERMKSLQELVPNANKTDKASMLDEIIDYVKFLQLQVKVLSMSRLGGAPAVAPFGAGFSSQGRGEQANGGLRRSSNGTQSASTNDSISATEHQVAKLMEEDMGSAMQYLQGKGLCLMPISLATAISTATSHSRSQFTSTTQKNTNGAEGPSSPNMSALTVQSTMMGNNASIDGSIKDNTSVSKP